MGDFHSDQNQKRERTDSRSIKPVVAKTFATALGATLVSGVEADAAIIYSGVVNDPNLIGATAGFTGTLTTTATGVLNLDGQAGNDFGFLGEVSIYSVGGSTLYSFASAFMTALANNRIIATGNDIVRLGYGFSIGAAATSFQSGQLRLVESFFSSTFSAGATTQVRNGNWANGQAGYVGLEFRDGSNQIHYGWAQIELVEVSVGGGTASGSFSFNVVDFAYESTPNASIQAGVIPEPSSLGLLALGAVGLGAWRKRQQAKNAKSATADSKD